MPDFFIPSTASPSSQPWLWPLEELLLHFVLLENLVSLMHPAGLLLGLLLGLGLRVCFATSQSSMVPGSPSPDSDPEPNF